MSVDTLNSTNAYSCHTACRCVWGG